LNVTARDKATGKEQKVTITASTNLSKSEIEKMVQTSREHESEDRQRRELIDARNTADNLAYQTEKTLRDLGDKVPSAERNAIEGKISELREAIRTILPAFEVYRKTCRTPSTRSASNCMPNSHQLVVMGIARQNQQMRVKLLKVNSVRFKLLQ
jgi:molecular chaperone DnaK (HSP70)